MTALHTQTLAELARGLEKSEFTSVELTQTGTMARSMLSSL
jgi:hypothetical protein